MALADRLVRTEPKTKFQAWLDSLKPEHRNIIHQWMTDPNISNTRIAQMIRDDDPDDGFVGYRANKDTVAEWRRANVSR